jgi:2-dehydro-3-deoxyphosphooctonate aldolase (KDO 8-P synthase)
VSISPFPAVREVSVGPVVIGGGKPLVLIAGPCVIESEASCLESAGTLTELTRSLGIPFIFKSSYDKANRSSLHSYRGPGLTKGLEILGRVKRELKIPVLSDVHRFEEVEAAAGVLDVLQIPAFLCRQTDLIHAAAATGRCVNIKKGQFLSPAEMRKALDKALETGNHNILLTERGTFFGYNNLVVDFRSFYIMRSFGQPVVFDVTHSVQAPGGQGDRSGGNSEYIPHLARAGAAAGVDGFFFEVHDNPEKALSDGPNALRLKLFPRLLEDILRIRASLRRIP